MKKSNQINYPCEEDINIEIGFKCPLKLLENPQFIDGKRFCDLCNKNVYDLRNLTNKEIYDLVSGKENICGRIQLERVSKIRNGNQNFFKNIFTGFALFAFIANVFSQKKDTMRTKEIEGFAVVAVRCDDCESSYPTPKKELKRGFKKGKKYIENARILKLNNSTITFGNLYNESRIDFSIEEDLVKKENVFLIETPEINTYYYAIVRKEKFEDYLSNVIEENKIVKSELPKDRNENSLYFIDGEELDYYEFIETVNTNAKDFYYFYLNPDLASVFLEEKTKKNLYVAYTK